MVTIGVDPHKQTHSGVAVDPLGVQAAQGGEVAVVLKMLAAKREQGSRFRCA